MLEACGVQSSKVTLFVALVSISILVVSFLWSILVVVLCSDSSRIVYVSGRISRVSWLVG